MNAERRNQLKEIAGQIDKLRYDLEDLLYCEREAYENIPENLQESKNGEKMYDGIKEMEGVIEALEDASQNLIYGVAW